MVQLLLPIIYISFISLGLPDSLLGSAWPSMYPALGVPVSYAGLISMIISFGTIVSSLNSDRLTRALGTGKVTALSVGMTAAALFGFSVSTQFWMLCLWAVPYGLGAGSVDAALNNYVALHYKSRHMSWLHCMWGIGTMISPMVMGRVLAGGGPWTSGYRYIALFQILLSAVLFFSLPLWQGRTAGTDAEAALPQVLSLGQVFRLPGAREVMLCFFCYCALETTAGLWASSYLTLTKGVAPDTAASFASLFYIGITAGRAACGFLTLKFNDTQMIRMGQCILAAGVLALLLPGPQVLALCGLVLVGLGCAPIYPSIIHSTPEHFGADRSQAVIGIQMQAPMWAIWPCRRCSACWQTTSLLHCSHFICWHCWCSWCSCTNSWCAKQAAANPVILPFRIQQKAPCPVSGGEPAVLRGVIYRMHRLMALATANSSCWPIKPNFASCASAKQTVSCDACTGSPKPAVWIPKCSTLRYGSTKICCRVPVTPCISTMMMRWVVKIT